MITAEEFFNRTYKPYFNQAEATAKVMIEFAKMHVESCKKEIANKAIEYHDSILTCYPLESIK